MIKSVLLQSK